MAQQQQLETFVKDVATESWRLFVADPLLYVLAAVLIMVLSVVSLGILSGPLTVGFLLVVMRRQRGEHAGVGDVFAGFDRFLSSLGVAFIVMVAIFIGCLFLVLPGLVVFIFTCFALQAVAVEGKGVFDAIGRSIDVVKANFLDAFVVLMLLTALHAVGSLVMFGVLLTFPLGLIGSLVAYQRLVQRTAQVQLTPQAY